MTFHVYILKCADNSYYTGHTDNLEQRLSQHQQRYFRTCYTATRLPVELLYCQEFPTREEALASERQIKGWSRKKKEAMMRGDWNEVSRLAQNASLRQTSLRQAQDDQSSSVHPELVEGKLVEGKLVQSKYQDIRSNPVRALRPFDPSSNSGLTAKDDRDMNQGNQSNTVRGEPVLRQAQDDRNNPVRGEPVEPQKPLKENISKDGEA